MKHVTFLSRGSQLRSLGISAMCLLLFSFLFVGSTQAQPCGIASFGDYEFQILPCWELNPESCSYCEDSCELSFVCVANEDGWPVHEYEQNTCGGEPVHPGYPGYWFDFNWYSPVGTPLVDAGQCLDVSYLNFGDDVCVTVDIRPDGAGINSPPVCSYDICIRLTDPCLPPPEPCCDPNWNIIANGDFNASNAACVNANFWTPYWNNCVPNWTFSHGTAQIFNIANDPFSWMWSHTGRGEGIVNNAVAPNNFLLVQGGRYRLQFRARSNGVAGNGMIMFTNNLGQNTTTTLPPIPVGSQTVWNQDMTTVPTNGWGDYCLEFTATANFRQMWVFPFRAAGPPQTELAVDDFCLQRVALFDGGGEGGRKVAGLEDVQQFSLYPNPATSRVNLTFDLNQAGVAKIVDLRGATLKEVSLDPNSGKVEIPLDGLARGIYMVRVEENGVLKYQHKLVVSD